MSTTDVRYSKVAIWLHWLIALLMIIMLIFGEDMIRRAKESFYPSVHVSLGISILVLSFIRILWRLTHKAPELPATMKSWEKKISHGTHYIFYVLMIALPVSGMMFFSKEATHDAVLASSSLFGILPVPRLQDFGGIGEFVHEAGSKFGQVLVLLHVAAALKHQFWDKDNLLRRMSPH